MTADPGDDSWIDDIDWGDVAAEQLAETLHAAGILRKYADVLPPSPAATDQLIAVMDAGDAAWWLKNEAGRSGNGGPP